MDGEEPMILNLGAAVNVVGAIRAHTAQATDCPEWDAPGIRAALADLLWQAWDKSGLDVEVRLGCGQVALSDQPCDVCRQARKDRQ